MRKRFGTLAPALLWSLTTSAAAQDVPATWRVVPDLPAAVVPGEEIPEGGIRFVRMAPGWHVTTRAGALFFEPRVTAFERFVVETEVFLFPDTGNEEFGLFLGGTDLEPGKGSYLFFGVRRDGRYGIFRVADSGRTPIAPWTADLAVVQPAGGTGKNLLRVVATDRDVQFAVNDKVVLTAPRSELLVDGAIGVRAGAGMNLHVSRFDLTLQLAPKPEKREER